MGKETVIPVSDIAKETGKAIAVHFVGKKEDEDDQETENHNPNVANDDELDREAEKRDGFDICEDVINRRVKRNLPVDITIYKNTKVAFTLENQTLTWRDVHQRLGACQAKIVAKYYSGNLPKTFTQAKGLDSYTEFVQENEKRNEAIISKDKDTLMTDTIQLIAKAQNEAEERADRKANQTISLMKEMFTLNRPEPKSDSSLEFMKMMMEMNEKAEARTQALIKEMNDRQEKQLERIMNESTKSIERVMETVQTLAEREDKEPPMDAFKIQAMIDKAKKDGREEAERLADMIEAKAEKLASKNNPDKKEESILDKTISSFLPMAPTILGKLMSAPSHPVPMSNSQTIQNPPQRTIQSPVKVNARPQLPAPHKPVVNAQTQQKKTGMATVLPVQAKKVEQSLDSAKIHKDSVDKIQALKKTILDVTVPLILDGLINEKGSLETANKIRNELSMKGIKASEAAKVVSLKEVNDLADSNGLTDLAKEKGQESELKLWLATLHEELSKASL